MVKYQDIFIVFDFLRDGFLLPGQQKELYEKYMSRSDVSVHVRTMTIKNVTTQEDVDNITMIVKGVSNSRIVVAHRKYIQGSSRMIKLFLDSSKVHALVGPPITKEWLEMKYKTLRDLLKKDSKKRAGRKDYVRERKVKEDVVYTDFMGLPILGQLPKGTYDPKDGKVAEKRQRTIMLRNEAYLAGVKRSREELDAKISKYKEGIYLDIYTMVSWAFPAANIMKSDNVFNNAWAFAKTNKRYKYKILREKIFAMIIYCNAPERSAKMLPIFKTIFKSQEKYVYGTKRKRSDIKNRVVD